MILDLTKKPVAVTTDACSGHVVVRTMGNRDVDGALRRKFNKNVWKRPGYENQTTSVIDVTVGKEMRVKDRTLKEYLLPLSHALPKQLAAVNQNVRRNQIIDARNDAEIPDPFEVASVCQDGFTGMVSSWRAQIILNAKTIQGGILWQVTIRDETTKTDLLTIQEKNLLTRKDPQFVFPLELVTAQAKILEENQGVLSVWDRLQIQSLNTEEYDEYVDQ